MNIFTEEVLRELQNGRTSTERVNNAINLIRFRNISENALSTLLYDIKHHCQNYKNWVWIADSIERFVYALEQEYELRTTNVPSIADSAVISDSLSEMGDNKFSFIDIIKKYGRAFMECLSIYDKVDEMSDDPFYAGSIPDVQNKINALKTAYNIFLSSLYDEIKDIADWNKQDTYLSKIQCYLSQRAFSGEFDMTGLNNRTGTVANNELRYIKIDVFTCLSEAIEWYGGTTKYHFKSFCNSYKDCILKLKLIEFEEEIISVIGYSTMYLNGNNHYDGDDYVGTDYSQKDLEESYCLLENRYNRLMLLLNYYKRDLDILNPYDYPHIQQLVLSYKECKKIYDIHKEVHATNNSSRRIVTQEHKAYFLEQVKQHIPQPSAARINPYYIDTSKLTKIFDLEQVFKCTVSEFMTAVENADFSKLQVNDRCKAKSQYLVYRLSLIMPAEWYDHTCRSIGVEKRRCSGATIDKFNSWRKSLDKLTQTSSKE